MAFCGKCGTKNPDDNLFCSKCGERLVSAELNEKQVSEPEPVTPIIKETESPEQPGHKTFFVATVLVLVALVGALAFLMIPAGTSYTDLEYSENLNIVATSDDNYTYSGYVTFAVKDGNSTLSKSITKTAIVKEQDDSITITTPTITYKPDPIPEPTPVPVPIGGKAAGYELTQKYEFLKDYKDCNYKTSVKTYSGAYENVYKFSNANDHIIYVNENGKVLRLAVYQNGMFLIFYAYGFSGGSYSESF